MGFPAWRLLVQTPAEVLVDLLEVDWVEVRLAKGGPLRILRGHAPLLAETLAGPLDYSTASGQRRIELEAGLLSVARGQVTVLTTAGQSVTDVQRHDERETLGAR